METETKLTLFEHDTVDDTRVEKLSLLVMKIVTTDRVQVIFLEGEAFCELMVWLRWTYHHS